MNSCRSRLISRRGFTLLEVVVVVLVIGIMAATVVPSLSAMGSSRASAALAEVQRALMVARERALATGEPSGVAFDLTNQTMQMVRISVPGASPSAAPSPLGVDSEAVVISSRYTGVRISGLAFPSGATSLWFSYDGVPQTRSSSGTLIGDLSADVSVALQSGGVDSGTVYVRCISGLVER
jgi:prepilin-type N-terminal cleavage/methylation domain-containing protein